MWKAVDGVRMRGGGAVSVTLHLSTPDIQNAGDLKFSSEVYPNK